MSVFRIISVLAVVCLATISAAQVSDQIVAERVLGPRWRQMSRASGMIFSGTVLRIEAQPSGKVRPLPLMLTRFRVDRAIAGVRSGEVLTVREWAVAQSMQRTMSRGERVLIFLYAPSRLGLTSPVGGRIGQVALDSRGEVVYTGVPLPDRSWLTEEPFHGDTATPGAKAQFHNRLTAALKRCSTQNHTQRPVQSPDRRPAQGLARSLAQSPTVRDECMAFTQPSDTLAQLERAIRNARLKLPTRTEE